MGIIAKQSIYNTLSIAIAFVIGAVNMLYLYPTFPGKEFQGLIVAVLANSNLIQPFVSFGVQHTLIKFFSDSESQEERDRLLWFVLFFPLLIIALILPPYYFYNSQILDFLSNNNDNVGRFPLLIIAVAISTAYFEIFFSWLRVHLHSVFGNFLKEVYPRLITFILLLLVAFQRITIDDFITLLIWAYYLRVILVAGYSFYIYFPTFYFGFPKQWRAMLKYSALIFLSGAAASFILDIDKSMLYALTSDENVAFYAVALYIAAVIEAPGRAMFQITTPLVAKALSEQNRDRLESLLKKSSINLMIVGGFAFLVINLNLIDFYNLINQEGYATAINVVIIVSVGKLFSLSLGCLNTILSNSKYYAYIFWFSVSSAVLAVVLNYYFIRWYGIIGAAYATLWVLFFINFCKILLVHYLFKIHPYTVKTISLVVSLFVIYGLVYWIPSLLDPLFSIAVRTLLITALFAIPFFIFRWSSDMESLLEGIKKRFL